MRISNSFLGVVLAAFVFFHAQAGAGIMIEPWVGYESGKMKCTTSGGSDCGGDVTGMHYGARLGYKSIVGLWVAGEYNGSSGLKTTQPNGDPDMDAKHTSIGATVGFDMLFGLRAFAGYNFSENLETTDSAGDTDKFYGGSSTKIGVGYKLPMIPLAFNLEMNSATYKKYKGSNGTVYDIDTVFSTFKHTGYILSVSAPFDF